MQQITSVELEYFKQITNAAQAAVNSAQCTVNGFVGFLQMKYKLDPKAKIQIDEDGNIHVGEAAPETPKV